MSGTKPKIGLQIILVVTGLLLSALPVAHALAGDVYTWKDAGGRVHFGDRPPAMARAEPVEIRINTYTGRPVVSDYEASGEPASGKQKDVVIYTTDWCGVCKKAKAYFKAHDIPFQEYDVEKTRKGRRDYERLKGRGVPIILVGNKRMNGFRSESFEKIYN